MHEFLEIKRKSETASKEERRYKVIKWARKEYLHGPQPICTYFIDTEVFSNRFMNDDWTGEKPEYPTVSSHFYHQT